MAARKPDDCSLRKRFGRNVARLRSRRDSTQEELAEKIGVSERYLRSVEAGEYYPSLPTLARLRATLRCEWNELFAGCEKI
jgi:transcriptional regulator with XRE-family HTH domain